MQAPIPRLEKQEGKQFLRLLWVEDSFEQDTRVMYPLFERKKKSPLVLWFIHRSTLTSERPV